MPLVVICGCPSSGKSEVCEELRQWLEGEEGKKVVVVAHRGAEDYESAEKEKMARGELFSAVERELAKDVVVICDACNYIGGFRYQLFCSAKSMQTHTMTIWCHGGDENCELGRRFEPPKEKNRWDRPLIVARRDPDTGKMVFDRERVRDALSGQVAAGPNLSTIPEPRGHALNVDQELTECMQSIVATQKEGGRTGLPRTVTLGELRQWKREYMQLSDLADVKKTADPKKSFVAFCAVKCTAE